jgi:hypothetical protein
MAVVAIRLEQIVVSEKMHNEMLCNGNAKRIYEPVQSSSKCLQ